MSAFGSMLRHQVLISGFLATLIAGFDAREEARAQALLSRWSVSEFQPDIRPGGRANTIAVHPTNNDVILVASDTGGLFRSTDRGLRWGHIDGLPAFATNSVIFVPRSPDTLIATTRDDFKTAGGGGIWRSTDAGASWTQAGVALPPGIAGRLSGYEIAVAPDTGEVHVATELGAARSNDAGATWTLQEVFGAASDRRVFSIVSLGEGRLIAGGPGGVRYSSDGGASWAASTTSVGGVSDLHALGRSPLSSLHAFLGIDGERLYRTEDGGRTWIQMASAPAGGGGCGGISFVKATRRSVVSRLTLRSFLDVYYSNRCGISRLVTSVNPVTRTTSFAGTWQSLAADHGDTRHLAFDNSGRPLLLATDGGLHATSDGGNSWTYAGGGRAGYNALQVTEIKGQLIEDVGRHDLYFGTQDNDLWSSGDRGATWASGACCEGFFIEAERRVPTSAQSKVTFVACGGCGNFVSDPRFTSVADWPNPPGEVVGNAMILRRSVHLQGVSDSDRLSKGLAITTNLGGSWQQFARFADDRRDLPKLARPGGGLQASMVYQAYRAPGWAPGGLEINHLLRVRKNPRLPGLASVLYPAMTNFGGLGINPTMFAWYQVYAVDPADAYHVIAPDVVNNLAMETRDGGETWTEIAQLTNLATDGGRLRFSAGMFPIITAVSFSPQSPQLVVAGTSEGGIYLSQDGGTSWSRLPRSEQVTYVTGFEWRSANDVVVSTYGRGLWRLQNRLWIISRDWIDWCRRPCEIRKPWRDRGDPPPFEAGILVYDGVVLDAREEAGILRELVVTPGSSIVQVGAEQEGALPVSVSYAPRRAELGQGLREFRPPQPGWIVKGIVLDPRNRVLAAAYGDRPMAMAEPKEPEERQGSTRSPSADRPHIQLMTKRSDGSPSATPGEVFGVAGRNFPDGSVVVLVLDGKPLPERIRVGQTGAFQAAVRAPKEHGLHRLEIRLQEQDRALDGSMFLVKHVDDFKRERRRQIR